MSKRSCSSLDSNSCLQPPQKKQRIMTEDEKDSEQDIIINDMTQTKTVTINGVSHRFISANLIKIDFFHSRYSSNWNTDTPCVIQCDSINFGTDELKMVIKYVSNNNNLDTFSKCDLFCPTNNFAKLFLFLECIDFFCLSSHLSIDNLCDYYYNTKHSTKITISDLFKFQFLNNKLLKLTSIKLIQNIYSETISERILSLKEHILKFKIDIDSGFIIKNDKDASDWFNTKINEFCVYRKYLSRDWIIISKSHQSLQRLFILNDLHEPIITEIKHIFDTFCRFCTIAHMKHINSKSNDVINIDLEQRQKSNIFNDVKMCTFPMIQLMKIFLFYIRNFTVIQNKSNNILKQTMDLITLLPTILKCAVFCGLKSDGSEEYKHCDRSDDLRFINIVNDGSVSDEKDLSKAMIRIYKEIINVLLDGNRFDFKCLSNDLSIIETLILPITHEIMDDQSWILSLFAKAKQKETILLASKLRNLILDLQLDGHEVNYSYMRNIELYLSYK